MIHTPGKWNTDPDCEHETVVDEHGNLIADCAIFGLERGQEENQANARLIAAAPDLLEALNACRIELMYLIEQTKSRKGGSVCSAHSAAVAAIAKATGAADVGQTQT